MSVFSVKTIRRWFRRDRVIVVDWNGKWYCEVLSGDVRLGEDIAAALSDFVRFGPGESGMTVDNLSVEAFGTKVGGVRIDMPLQEALVFGRAMQASVVNPPKDRAGNVDYEARDLASKVATALITCIDRGTV